MQTEIDYNITKFEKTSPPKITKESIVNLLQNLGVENFYLVSDEEIRCSCPLHKGDNITSFVVYLKNKRYKCWSNSCHEKHGSSIKVLFNLLDKNITPIEKTSKPNILFSSNNKYRVDEFDVSFLLPYPRYQLSRHIPEKPIFSYTTKDNRYQMKDRAVFPIWDITKNKIMGLTGRALDENNNIKWKHVLLKNISHVVYCPHSLPYNKYRVCLLSEGPIDAIKLELAIGLPSIAMLGNIITYKKAETLVPYFDKFILVIDNDEAGIQGSKKTQKILSEFGMSTTILTIKEKNMDPGDFEINELRKRFSSECRNLA